MNVGYLRRRMSRDEGFTLIELLIVLVIIGVLLAIAVPSYIGFKDRANKRAAQSDIRETVPTMEAFYSDNGTYTGGDTTALRGYDSGMSAAVVTSAVGGGNIDTTPNLQTYCIGASVGGQNWSVSGPGATNWYNAATNCTGTTVQTP